MSLMLDELASFRFLLRNDTAANWTSQNPVLAEGEPGVETDTHLMKLGDGVTAWNDLDYSGAGGAPGPAGRGIENTTLFSTVGLVKTYHLNYDDSTFDSFTVTNGADGTNGTNGTNGSIWRSGSGAPAGGLGVVGDWYVNTGSTNYDYYEKTGASTWTLRGSLRGPTGTNGSNGATGATGPAGPGWAKPSQSDRTVTVPTLSTSPYSLTVPAGKVYMFSVTGGSGVAVSIDPGGGATTWVGGTGTTIIAWPGEVVSISWSTVPVIRHRVIGDVV